MSRLEEIKARADAATEGPWEVEESALNHKIYSNDGIKSRLADIHMGIDNAQFIAHARADVPWLLERLDKAANLLDSNLDGMEWLHERKAVEQFLESLTPKPKDQS